MTTMETTTAHNSGRISAWRAAWEEACRLSRAYAIAAHASFSSSEAVALRREWRTAQGVQMALYDELTEAERAEVA